MTVADTGSASPMGSTTPPGWYDDRATRRALRWWDGRGWTEHTHALRWGQKVTPAGWYDDQRTPGALRWWDGLAWSDQSRPSATSVHDATPGEVGRCDDTFPGGIRYYRPPGDAWPRFDIVGESFHAPAIQRVLGRLRLNEQREVMADALVVPEPNNRHDPKAIAVLIGGEVVGYLSREDARRYGEVVHRLVGAGARLSLAARVWGRNEGARLFASVNLALPEPHLLAPLNAAPLRPYSLVPWGGRIHVGDHAERLSVLRPYLSKQSEALFVATLVGHTETSARGAVREWVDVLVDGVPVGALTPAMSKNIGPLIAHLASRELAAAAWMEVRGTSIAAEVSLRAIRATDVPEGWLSGPPVRLMAFT